jgi:hypothetical protein
MDKRWYSVAFSAAIVGCSGDVDDGSPGATGGGPNNYYGPAVYTGGAPQQGGTTSINSGTPSFTGGMPAAFYGVLFVTGGNANIGGSTSGIDAGAPAATGGRLPTVYGVLPTPVPSAPTEE